MSKKIDPRSAIKKAKDAAYAKLPPAKILKPLRFIRANTERLAITNQAGEVIGFDDSAAYKAAREDADRGHGAYVQAQARAIALAA